MALWTPILVKGYLAAYASRIAPLPVEKSYTLAFPQIIDGVERRDSYSRKKRSTDEVGSLFMILGGKTALVTGASRGIGAVIAKAYAKGGATVGCLARSVSDLGDTTSAIEADGGKAIALESDVTDTSSLERALARLTKASGKLDLLVVNAGINIDRRSVEDSDPEAWQRTIDVNLIGAYNCLRLAIPYLKESGSARVITIGSGTGHHARNSNSSYICSKAALWALTRVLANELSDYNISVNELVPGPVKTYMTREGTGEGGVLSIGGEWTKEPEDIVPLAMFLATCPEPGPSGQSFSLMRRTG